MRGLLKNEFTKVFKQNAYRIILIIFAVAVIAMPFLGLAEKAIFNMEMNADELYDSYISTSQMYSEMGDGLEADYWRSYAEAVKFFSDNELEPWKLDYLLDGDVGMFFPDPEPSSDSVYSYADYFLRARALELLENGEHSENALWMSSYSYVLNDYFYTDSYYFGDDGWYNSAGVQIANPYTDEDISSLKSKASKELYTLSDMIIACDASQVISDHAEHTRKLKKEAEAELELLNLTGADKDLLATAERALQFYTYADDMFQRLKAENVGLDDWRFDFCVAFLTSFELLPNYTLYPVSYEDFLAGRANEFYMYDSYEEYLYDIESTVKDAEAAINVAHYAVMNNIPPEGADSSVKQDVREQIVSISGFVLIFSTVLAGMTVANEFSSGTVRLLLIRPKKRWKILLSKLSCVLMLHLSLIVISTITLAVINVIIGGVGDLFTPDLTFADGKVVEIAAMLETLYTVALVIIQSLPIITLAFALSTLMKKSVLALVIAFVANSFSGIVQLVACMLAEDIPLLKITILPYMSLADLRFSASDVIIKNLTLSNFDLGMIFGTSLSPLAGGGFDPILAIAVVLVHVGALVAIAFGAFKKAQV